MRYFYNILVLIARFSLKIVALFNKKIKLFINGRKDVFEYLKANISTTDKVIWFHCASLGEFEQGRPVIEKLKSSEFGVQSSEFKVLVTFFSPSGYEVRKDYAFADAVCYLPLDTASNARKFIEIVHPDMAVFVKYEFWPNFLHELKQRSIKTILISGIFREKQAFFKGYGAWMRKSLKTFDHFFVQNEKSKKLLNSINFSNVTVSGDTRFDRVFDILNQDNSITEIEAFKDGKLTLVAGSTWQEGEKLLIDYVNNYASENEKFIIAPHNINPKEIENLKASFSKKTMLFSQKNNTIKDVQVLIIDSIGMLTKIYSYADVAYVGGAFKTGLHNVLEPATYGVPILIGPQFQKFNEAIELVEKGGCIVINSQEEFNKKLKELFENKANRQEKGAISANYVKSNLGATTIIVSYIKNNF